LLELRNGSESRSVLILQSPAWEPRRAGGETGALSLKGFPLSWMKVLRLTAKDLVKIEYHINDSCGWCRGGEGSGDLMHISVLRSPFEYKVGKDVAPTSPLCVIQTLHGCV
jgi:hypothetical protein